jgi:hypothetical protein
MVPLRGLDNEMLRVPSAAAAVSPVVKAMARMRLANAIRNTGLTFFAAMAELRGIERDGDCESLFAVSPGRVENLPEAFDH